MTRPAPAMLSMIDLEGAARDLAEALVAANAAWQAGERQHAHAIALAARLEAMKGERAGIIARQQEGWHEDGDGARLALIGADIEGITDIVERAKAGLVRNISTIQEAQRKVEAAEYVIDQLKAEDREADQLFYVAAIERAVMEVSPMLADVRQVVGGGRPRWSPSRALLDGLRRLDLQPGRLH